jgi:hypothetical protein
MGFRKKRRGGGFASGSRFVGFYSNARPVPTVAKLFPVITLKGGGP